MSFNPHRHPRLGTGAQVFTVVFLLFLLGAPTASQNAASTPVEGPVYFPAGAINGFDGYVSSFLKSVGEPSLLATAQDPSATSYRLVSLAGQTGKMVSVRLSLNLDGSARVFTILDAGESQTPRRSLSNLVPGDVRKFQQLVVKAGFWSMPSIDTPNNDGGAKSYKMDASTWVFEGVRDHSYHVVLRHGASPNSFNEIVHFLSRDLAKLQ